MQHFIIIPTIRIYMCINNAEKILFKTHFFSRKFKEINLLGYQKGNTQYIFGNIVGEQ